MRYGAAFGFFDRLINGSFFMNRQIRQILLPLLAAAIWGAAFLVQGDLGEIFPPFFINFARSMLAVVALLVVSFCFDFAKKKKTGEPQKVNFKMLVIGGICCGLSLCGAINVQQIGINHTSSGVAAFITALYMVLVPLFGVFLKRKVGVNIWISVAFGVIGLAFICQLEAAEFNVYYIYLIVSAIFFAIQILCVDYFVTYVDGVKLSCAQFLVAGIVSGILSLCTETIDMSRFSEAILPLLYLGVFSSAVGYTLQIIAQKGTNPTVVSLLLSMESAFALIFSVLVCLFTGEAIKETPLQFLGCALMLFAIIFSQINPFKKKTDKVKSEKD